SKDAAVWRTAPRFCFLDDLAQIEHRNAMAEKSDGAQIVRDEQIRRAKFALQSDQEVDDLGACGWIKRRSRLIQYDELRSRNDGAANTDTLLLAGAQLHRKL